MKLQPALNIAENRIEKIQQPPFIDTIVNLNYIAQLREADETEVSQFLKKRPVHTVVMTGFIRDNGLESVDNRGKFYGYRSAEGKLKGVALIGHTTLVEARSEEALKAFALIARGSETPIHLMMSDSDTIERFWRAFADKPRKPRLVCTELLFELNFPYLVRKCEWEVRKAKPEELEMIAEAHAEVALIESGVNPLEKDREGFLYRCLKRIKKGRTFVVTENGKLVFKADIAAATEDVVYLEGIYVTAEKRGLGIGSECLAKLSLKLLESAQHICMLSNVDFRGAHRSFEKAGFNKTDSCQTIFV